MKISIIVSNYNYAKFLNEALLSAHLQSYKNTELIVVDDGSTDGSREILKQWEDKATVIYQENQGQVAAYNTGFNVCTGDLVLFLDSDDILDKTLAAKVIPMFNQQSTVKVHFKMRLVDEYSRPTGTEIPSLLSEGDMARPLLEDGWLYASSPGSGNVYRKSALEKLFPLPVSKTDKVGADFFCIYGIVFFGNIASIEESLCSYRVHNKTTNSAQKTDLVFGNAAKSTDEIARFQASLIPFKSWITNITNGEIVIKHINADFSITKQAFTRRIFESKDYLSGVTKGLELLPTTIHSIYIRRNYSIFKILAVVCMLMAIIVLPRQIGLKLASFIANPAAR